MARDTGMAQLLRSPLLWVLTLGYISSITGSILITANMVPMARSWGFSAHARRDLARDSIVRRHRWHRSFRLGRRPLGR